MSTDFDNYVKIRHIMSTDFDKMLFLDTSWPIVQTTLATSQHFKLQQYGRTEQLRCVIQIDRNRGVAVNHLLSITITVKNYICISHFQGL